jgi:hypothetical protein
LSSDSADRIGDADSDYTNTKILKNKSKKKSTKYSSMFIWSESRRTFLDIFDSILSINPSNLWRMSLISENFLAGIWSQILYILETRPIGVAGSSNVEIKLRNFCASLIIKCISLFSTSSSGSLTNVTTAILDSLIKYEQMSSYIATICITSQSSLLAEIMKEIGSMKMAMQAKSAGNIGSFLEALAKGSPSLMSTYMPHIKHLVDSVAHQIRSSILVSMGFVVSYIHKSSELIHQVDNIKMKDNNEEEDNVEVNIAQLNRTRDSLLDIIVERTHDVTHYTRSTVLKVFISLLESNSIPVRRVGTIGGVAVDRLFDKTTLVRKSAVSLLTSLLENNPFSSCLDINEFEKQKEELIVKLLDRIEHLRENSAEVDEDDDNTVILTPSKSKKPCNDDDDVTNDKIQDDDEEVEENNEIIEEDLFLQSADVLEDSEFISIKAQIDYCEGGLNLIMAMTAAMPRIEEMLKSKNSSDVIEGLRFFTKAVHFSIKGSAKFLRSAFSLIWHQEESIRLECLNAFKNVYLTDGGDGDDIKPLDPIDIATNIVQLCKRCDVSELVSFEYIIGDLFLKEQVDKAVISSLWSIVQESQIFNDNGDIINEKSEDLSSLLSVISMIGKYLPDSLTANRIKAIIQISFSKKILSTKQFNIIKAGSQCLNAAVPYIASIGMVVQEDIKAAYNIAAPALRDVILGDNYLSIYLFIYLFCF